MTVLVTGFEPFGANAINPTADAVAYLARDGAGDLATVILPVDWDRAWPALEALIASVRPAAVLLLGLSARAEAFHVERFALNVEEGGMPDNAGVRRTGTPIVPTGPAAYRTAVRVEALVAALNGAGVPAAPRNHTGSYLCNQVYYHALHRVAASGNAMPVVFVHVPPYATAPVRLTHDGLCRAVRVLAGALSA